MVPAEGVVLSLHLASGEWVQPSHTGTANAPSIISLRGASHYRPASGRYWTTWRLLMSAGDAGSCPPLLGVRWPSMAAD